MQRFPPQNLRTPGPTPIPSDIVEAMTNPMINHRGPEFDTLLNKATEQLKQVFMTKNDPLILTASGTGLRTWSRLTAPTLSVWTSNGAVP